MADGIEEAAAAFTTAIQSETAPPVARPPKQDITEGPPDRLFKNIGELEVDEDSPAKGGGDDDDIEVVDKDVKVDEEPDEDGVEEEDTEGEEKEDKDGDEDGDEDKDQAEFFAQKVAVTVDGEAKEVTLKEAIEGYIRTDTFHKRMNDVEEAKKIIGTTAKNAVETYEYSVNLAKEIQAHLEALVPAEPDWDAEFKANPIKAREIQKYYDQIKTFRADLHKKLSDADAKIQENNAIQVAGYAKEESRRFDNLNAKSWATDPTRKFKDLKAMRRTALSQGFSEEEVGQVFDSRMLQVLLKASRYDRIMASKPKPVRAAGGGKQISGGGGSARSKVNGQGMTTAMKRLNKSGHVEDAALVFDAIIGREKKA